MFLKPLYMPAGKALAQHFFTYIGAGAHASLYPVGTNRPDIDKDIAGHVFLPGVDAIVGIEYFFPGAPIMISVDIKPEYNFGIVNRPDLTNGGISLRYRF